MGAMKRKFDEENDYGDGLGWKRGRVLGKGSFGRVFKASRKEDEFSSFPAELAVKSAEISVSGTLWDEKEMLRRLKGCDYVIQCYGGETTVHNGAWAYNLLLEYASGGTLADRIRERLPESEEVRAYTESILMGLCQIHAKGVVHCDLKPANILLVPNEGGGLRAKISDFGLSKKKKKKSEEDGNCHWRGTPLYLSPESVTGRQQEAPADIWALGCVVLEMLTGKRPWEGRRKEEILASIASENRPNIPDSISDDARDFLMCCFEREPEWRLSAKSLLDHHPFVLGHWEDYDFEEDYEPREDEFCCEEYESREDEFCWEENESREDEFSCEERESQIQKSEDDEYFDDGWMLSNKIEDDSSFASRLCPLKEEAFVGIAAGA